MSARTAGQHTADELTYHGTSGEIAVFFSASTSRPGTRNFTYRDTVTKDAHCDCKGAECWRQCWHLDWLETAWIMTLIAPFIATLDAAALRATGTASRARLADGSATVTGIAVYYQSQAEYRRRQAATATVIVFPGVAVAVAA